MGRRRRWWPPVFSPLDAVLPLLLFINQVTLSVIINADRGELEAGSPPGCCHFWCGSHTRTVQYVLIYIYKKFFLRRIE